MAILYDIQYCIDCGTPIPGGGFCRDCLNARIRKLSEEYDKVLEEETDAGT